MLLSLYARITILVASTWSTIPLLLAIIVTPLSLATIVSIPVPTNGLFDTSKGTACLCMFEPIKALLASSFSKKGIKAAATDTSCFGETSIISIFSGLAKPISPAFRTGISSPSKLLSFLSFALAWAIVYLPSSIADIYSTVSVTFPF